MTGTARSRRPATLAAGMDATIDVTVTAEMTAEEVGSGDVRVLATPELARLVERETVRMLWVHLADGWTTVGTSISVEHEAPTPVGGSVRLRLHLEPGEGRSLRFDWVARDDAGEIARGTHVRVIVERERFEAAAEGRLRTP